jgi:hypothetical protein
MALKDLYSYAFVEKPRFALTLPQGAASQLVLIDGTDISVIVEPGITLGSFQDDDQKIIKMALCHDRVICELFQQITVLPLQFGICFDSEQNLLVHLEANTEKYRNQLEKINGKTQFTLKLTPKVLEELMPVQGKGKDYFLAKKQQYQNHQNFIIGQTAEKEALIDLIAKVNKYPVVIEEKEEEVRIHILVNTEDKNLFLDERLSWENACPRWDLLLSDSLPPYHFI